MVVTDIFDAEVTDNEDREDGAPLVVPNARSGGYVIVASHVELSLEEFVGKDSRLWETVDAFSNLEIDSTIMNVVEEIVFLDKFLRVIGEC